MSLPSNSNNNNNNKERPHGKKRRWYYSNPNKKPNHSTTPSVPPSIPPSSTPPIVNQDIRQQLLKQYEKEREENEKQVSKMEQQLHEFFHKTKTPYSYIDDKGIYSFTPTSDPTTTGGGVGLGTNNGKDNTDVKTHCDNSVSTNPFMNMTFNPFVPSNSTTMFPTLWTGIFPVKIVDTTISTVETTGPSVPVATKDPVFIEIREKIEHIDDLIALCDKYPLADDKKYNINMSAIHAIREPLCDLSNMVGMLTIKRTIVDQILYYLQELHIPETKKTTANGTATGTDTAEKKVPEEPKLLNAPIHLLLHRHFLFLYGGHRLRQGLRQYFR